MYTRVQKQILCFLLDQPGYRYTSLFQLANELGVDYSNAWNAVKSLEDTGLLDVNVFRHGMTIRVRVRTEKSPRVGGVSVSLAYSVHRPQMEVSMDDQRGLPEVPEELQKSLVVAVNRINAIRDQQARMPLIAAIVYENARLLQEVNQLRSQLNIPVLPVYDPLRKNDGK